jgi:hypothetical protein
MSEVMRRLCWKFIACWILLAVPDAYAGPAEDEAISTFRLYCVENINKPAEFPKLMKDVGADSMPDDLAMPYLSTQKGKVWPLLKGKTRLLLSLTDAGTCSITALEVDDELLLVTFASTFKNKLLGEEVQGAHTLKLYAITQKDIAGGDDVHVIAALTVPTLPSQHGVLMNSMPESLLKSQNFAIPLWP